MILHFIIVTIFIFFAVRFLIIYSLRKRETRVLFLKSAIKAIYHIPVFLQGLFLLCFSLMNFVAVVKEFYFFLYSLVFKSGEIKGDLHLLTVNMSVIVLGSFLLSLNLMLGKRTANRRFTIDAVTGKIGYLIFSICMVALLHFNLPFSTPFSYSLDELYFYNNIYVMIVGAFIGTLLLVLPYFFTCNNKFFNYAQLSVRLSISYFLICMLIAFIFFLFVLFFHLIGV